MKAFFKFIFFIPNLLVRLVWELIWGTFKFFCLLAIIVLLLLFYAQNSNSALAQNISTISNNLSTYFNSAGNGDVASDISSAVSSLATDEYSSSSQARWSTNTASVYIETTDQTLVSAYKEAIENWNSTGAFTFTLTDNEAGADIVATDYSDSSSQAAGLANTTTDVLTNHINHVDVMLNTYYLTDNNFGYSYDRIVNTAEHELGHAIGLDHDDSEDSVMQSSGSYYSIQDSDIQAVKNLYAA
ncbi:matrixin family metalloprotease [Streptococcus loxodontisalivarius]|uniref:Zn-dependent protease n=1 Tax=Streptococcus loxodontisalivarius TaxID=1349415 RepID=A0ABS2PQS4_9STRE|nr:matrixin family metalloprotease [Streptococcus loxodontisalivarius]MBM7641722.1 putative Zn-dependent protease [Streptococcus loxodontisalivarius]